MKMVPVGGSNTRSSKLANVVLPLPVRPTMASVWPGSTVTLISFSAGRSVPGYVKVKFLNFDAAFDGLQIHRVGLVEDFRLFVEDDFQPGYRRLASLQVVDDPADGHHRPRQHAQVHVEGDEVAQADGAEDDQRAAVAYDDEHAQGGQKSNERMKQAPNAHQVHVHVDVVLVDALEPLNFRFLPGERLDDPNARQVFLHDVGQIRKRLLHSAETPVNEAAEVAGRQRQKGQRQQGPAPSAGCRSCAA